MDYQKLYDEKVAEVQQLNAQMTQFSQQSNFIISDLEDEIKQLKKKNQQLNKELNEIKVKRKNFNSTVQRQIELAKKQRNEFKNKFVDFEKKVIELQNINENLQSDLRATKSILNEYEVRTEKTMEELALVQIQLQETATSSKQQIARLRSQLKETEDQLYVLHNVKHKKEQQPEKPPSNRSIHIKQTDSSVFKTTLAEIRTYINTLSHRKLQIRKAIDKDKFQL